MTKQVTFKGSPLALAGTEIKAGDAFPDVELTGTDMKPVKLSSFKGKTIILATVPSLSTPVCDAMTRRFNEEAAKLGKDVVIITASTDLPTTQKQWCGAAGISQLQVLSDHKDTKLGQAFGVLIKDWRMLARAVFVIDRSGVVRFAHVVPEIAEQPNYQQIIDEVKSVR